MRNFTKSLLVCILAAICAIGFTACGDNGTGDQGNNGDTPKQTVNYGEINFGAYPQSDVTAAMGETLRDHVNDMPNSDNAFSWTSYRYYKDNNNDTDYMWYKDVDTDGDGSYDYRAVYFTLYRPDFASNGTTATHVNGTHQDENGYAPNTVYWFKYEPLKWQIIAINGNEKTLVCKSIIDSQLFAVSDSNDYADSDIRAWLNDNFYNAAFSESERALINTVSVDNSDRSANPDNDAKGLNNGVNEYACENTSDKVWLLSIREATKSGYGFSEDCYDDNDQNRIKAPTKYAQCQGIEVAENGKSNWWLRSPAYVSASFVCKVAENGFISNRETADCYSMGVVPAIQIKGA